MLRGGLFEVKQDFERAISDYKEAIKLSPDSVLAKAHRDRATSMMLKKGLEAELKGEAGAALRTYDKAISVNPRYGFSYFLRGILYEAKGEIDRALIEVSEAIRLEPTDARYYTSRAKLYVAKNDMANAEADFNVAMKLAPKSAEVPLARAEAYESKDMTEQALAAYEQALSLEPASKHLIGFRNESFLKHFKKALDFERNKNPNLATVECNWAIGYRSDAPEAYLLRGRLYELKNSKAKAIADLQKVLQLSTEPGVRQQAEEILKRIVSTRVQRRSH